MREPGMDAPASFKTEGLPFGGTQQQLVSDDDIMRSIGYTRQDNSNRRQPESGSQQRRMFPSGQSSAGMPVSGPHFATLGGSTSFAFSSPQLHNPQQQQLYQLQQQQQQQLDIGRNSLIYHLQQQQQAPLGAGRLDSSMQQQMQSNVAASTAVGGIPPLKPAKEGDDSPQSTETMLLGRALQSDFPNSDSSDEFQQRGQRQDGK